MNEGQPAFVQLMETIENDIIAGVCKTDELIISTTQIARLYSVNPSAAVKAVSKLTTMGVICKRRAAACAWRRARGS